MILTVEVSADGRWVPVGKIEPGQPPGSMSDNREDGGIRIAREELAAIDEDTRAWWEAPEPSCDGVNCGHDHKLVGAILEGLLER